jgi:hypothetical protein
VITHYNRIYEVCTSCPTAIAARTDRLLAFGDRIILLVFSRYIMSKPVILITGANRGSVSPHHRKDDMLKAKGLVSAM